MVRSKRLKQIKHKRQTNHKRQTKNKRHRQYGGVSMTYRDYTREFGFSSKNLVIPGYGDILSMIELYNNRNTLKQRLDEGIKRKVQDRKYIKYTECKSPELSTPLDSIIVLKKPGFINFSTSIECTDNIYIELASHNFRIFIEQILNWNPFVNIPYHELELASDVLRYTGNYNGLHVFRQQEWWDNQLWWTSYKEILQDPSTSPPAAAAKTVEAEITGEIKERLVKNLKSEIKQLEEEILKLQTLLQVKKVELQHAQRQPAEQQLRQQEQ